MRPLPIWWTYTDVPGYKFGYYLLDHNLILDKIFALPTGLSLFLLKLSEHYFSREYKDLLFDGRF